MAVDISTRTDEERMILDMVRTIGRERVAPRAAAIDASGEFPWDMKELLAEQGILGLPFEEKYGGVGASELTILQVIEELSKHCATTGLLLAVQQLGSLPIKLAGTEEQKQQYFPRLASGEWLAAFGLTEPGSGSDAGAMKTRAEKRGDTYVLNGLKHFITNAGVAHVNVIFAKTDTEAPGTRGVSAFIVESDRPGFRLGRVENKMGIRGSQTGELIMEECVIPAGNLLGREGEGFKIAMMTLDRTRPGVGAQALGIAQGALDYAVKYAKERVQFGQPIAENQGIQFMLAGMATKVEAARQMLYNVARLIDENAPGFSPLSAMAKMYASDIAMEVTGDAVQILGGYGYMKEYPVERMMRDAKICQIYEGTNQIQKLVIARSLLK